jgi:hypothetical protein
LMRYSHLNLVKEKPTARRLRLLKGIWRRFSWRVRKGWLHRRAP